MSNKLDQNSPRTLGQRLRFSRQEKHWTQEQLARQAGTNQAVIQKIENGKSLRPRKIDDIASVLGVSPAWLMFGDKSENSLSADAIAVAQEWSRLPEPQRLRIWQEIIGLNQENRPPTPLTNPNIG